ncbi:hypothetical protein Tco_1020431 [Tanacetum coccineum]
MFGNYMKKFFNKDKITKEDLEDPAFELLKNRFKNSIELEYNLEQCHLALTNRIDWTNLEGKRFHNDLSKPLPLTRPPGRKFIPTKYFFNNYLEYLRHENKEKKIKVVKKYGYGYFKEIVVKRAVKKEYIFAEANFPRLNQNDIKDIIVIRKRVEDVQLGVESYQKKLNLTKPQFMEGCLYQKVSYTTFSHHRGVMYEGIDNQKTLMRANKTHKFSDGTLNKVYNKLDVMLETPGWESSGIESGKQNTSSSSRNDADADDADIKLVYDEEPMAKVQLTAECNVSTTGQQHTEQPEFNTEGEVDQNAEQSVKSRQHGQFSKVKSNQAKVKHDIDVLQTINIELEHKVAKLLKENETLKKHYKELYDSIKTTRAKTIEHTTSLIAKNDEFKAQLQEKGFAIAALTNELRKLTGNSVNTKFVRTSILRKPVLQPHRNQSVVRQPTAFKFERPRISKPRFASQVDVNNNLSKPVTTHYFPKERESAIVKPHHVIASSESRNSSKNMPRFSSNDMVYNHYLDEARKKTQEKGRNSEPSVMPYARSQSTTNGSKPKPRSNTQTSRN